MKNIVYLIEDEKDIMYVYKTALSGAGISVEPLASGKEAMEKIEAVQAKKEEKPVLVLLDLVLPDINGLEILNALRKHKETKDIPVFILSNYTSDALLNMTYIKPDKVFLKATITPTMLVEEVRAQLAQQSAKSAK